MEFVWGKPGWVLAWVLVELLGFKGGASRFSAFFSR